MTNYQRFGVFKRIRLLTANVLMIVAGAFNTSAQAQATSLVAFPSAPIKYVVPSSTGGLIDTMARLVAQSSADGLKQPVIVENKPGANTVLGATFVSKAIPDGHTWLAVSIALAANAGMPGVTFDPNRSLIPVARLASTPMGIAVPVNSPYNTLAELVAASKVGRPLNFGSGGYGTPSHLALALFEAATGVKANHVPYKGGAPALTDLVGGQLDWSIVTISEAQQFIRSGKLKLLAVTNRQRLDGYPRVPTTGEAGYPSVLMAGWTGIMVPAGTPPEVVNNIARTVLGVIQQPQFIDRAEKLGFEMAPLGPSEFAQFFRGEVTRLGKLIKAQNVRME